MNSLSPACQALKEQYDTCFNEWFREKYLKGDRGHDPCALVFKDYQECVRNAIKDKKISWDTVTEDVLGTDKEHPALKRESDKNNNTTDK